jgi:putative hydrolase of the HAD superfamily
MNILCVGKIARDFYRRRMAIKLICVDADDTLWHNERHFAAAEHRFLSLLEALSLANVGREALAETSVRNLDVYGYGAKSFTLSMIETVLEIGGDRVPTSAIREMLSLGRALLMQPVELFEGVENALGALAQRGPLVLVTKGDLHHQEAKVSISGLGNHFVDVEIVSDKTPQVFSRIFARHSVAPGQAIVIGDSMRSDILPALAAGAWAAHIPHALVWAHEKAGEPAGHGQLRQFERLADVPAWIDSIDQGIGR